jgi:hypothetical protein
VPSWQPETTKGTSAVSPGSTRAPLVAMVAEGTAFSLPRAHRAAGGAASFSLIFTGDIPTSTAVGDALAAHNVDPGDIIS